MKIINASVLFVLTTILMMSCDEKQKSTSNKEVISQKNDSTPTPDTSTSFERFKKRHNMTSNYLEDYKTKYKDGRKSEIRMLLTYESFDDSLKLYPKDKTKIALVVIEWNKNEGIVTTENSSFANLNDNQMYGGDVETNRRVAPSSSKFVKSCEQFFDKNIDKFTKISEVPNRDLAFVSFDFVTNKGIFTAQESLKNLENNKSIFSQLFNEGKKLKLETENVFNRKELK